MKKILVIVFSNLKHDARVMRHVNFLKDEYDVTVACLDAPASNQFKVVKLPPQKLTLFKKLVSGSFLLTRFYSIAHTILYPYQSFSKQFVKENFDLIVANDVETLPLAFAFSGSKTKVFFDAHEYAPRHFENVQTWRIFFQSFNIYLCKQYIPRVHGMVTVGRKIAEEYFKHFGVLPEVITNAPAYREFKTRTVKQPIKLVHHGIGTPSRKIEIMIEMMRILPDHFTLDLILMTPPSASAQTKAYLDELKTLAQFTDRIKFLPPVPVEEILPLINQYDIGLIIIPPINFNYANGLPNKFFDNIQAHVALAIGPTPEMAEIVIQHNLGVVSEDFSPKSLADKIRDLTLEQIQTFKNNSGLAAHEHSAEKNRSNLLRIIRGILE
jgi:glycosyltransferase involved in cell wall biosynthesis